MKGTLMIGLLVVIFVRTYVLNKFNEVPCQPKSRIFVNDEKDWEEVTEDTFKVFNSALNRAKFKGLKEISIF
jgi:hypothetical protein